MNHYFANPFAMPPAVVWVAVEVNPIEQQVIPTVLGDKLTKDW
jgi:hypothetical protein